MTIFMQRSVTALLLGGFAVAALPACNGSTTQRQSVLAVARNTTLHQRFARRGTGHVAIGVAGSPNFTNISYAGTSNGTVGISQYTQFNGPTQNVFIYHRRSRHDTDHDQQSIASRSCRRGAIRYCWSVRKQTAR